MLSLKLIALGVIFAPALLTQQGDENSGKQRCEEFNQKGWTVPGLLGATKQARGPIKDMDGIFLSVLNPGEAETSLATPICPAVEGKSPEYHQVPIKVLKLWSFDAGGAVFAYRVEYADEVIHQDGTRGELASYSVVFFYDTDGLGRFTLMRPSSMIGRNYFDPALVPKWAKEAAAPQPMK